MEDLNPTTQQAHLLAVSTLKSEITAARPISQETLVPLTVAKSIEKKDQYLSMHYSTLNNLARKDAATNRPASFNPFLNLPPQQIIKDLGISHRLLFNGFYLYPEHLLVITKEFQSQNDKLTKEDISYAALASEAVNGLLFFNGGAKSGATQPHKHLQVLPQQATKLPIFAEIYQYISERINKLQEKEIIRFQKFNFMHGIIPIFPSQPFKPLGERLYKAYLALYEQFVTKQQQEKEERIDYNLIACDKFILIIPRKQTKAFEKLPVSSLVFLGWLLFNEQPLMQQFLSLHGPSSVLQSISFQ